MKLLFVLSASSLFLYLLILPLHQYIALGQATEEVKKGDLDTGVIQLEQSRRGWPEFFSERRSALCGEITLQRARRMVERPDPDFVGAAGLLHDIETRCGTSGRDGEAARLLERVAALHLTRATGHCERHDYTPAFQDFQQLLTLPYPDRVQAQARAERAWCRLDLVSTLAQREMFEAALEELRRVLADEHAPVLEAARKQLRSVLDNEIRSLLERKRYPQVFKRLEQHQQAFGDEPETADFIVELANHVEQEVFGVALARLCREPVRQDSRKQGRNKPQGPVTVNGVLNSQPVDGSLGGNLVVHNDTRHRLKLFLRGLEHRDVLVEPRAKQELQVAPAEYLVGVYAPGNCRIKPDRTTWRIRPSGGYAVRFYEG